MIPIFTFCGFYSGIFCNNKNPNETMTNMIGGAAVGFGFGIIYPLSISVCIVNFLSNKTGGYTKQVPKDA